jgi:hypothetical protein
VKRVVLVPRPGSAAPTVDEVNEYLESERGAVPLDADQFVVEISNADIANQCHVTTGFPGETIETITLGLETAGHAYGAGLVSEVRRLCADLANRFDLLVKAPDGSLRAIAPFFDEGGL